MPGDHGAGCKCVHETELRGAEFLLPFIQLDGVRAMNERTRDSAKGVLKTYEERLTEVNCLSEEDDPELIVHIPFKAPCKLSGLHIIGGDFGTSPKSVSIFADVPDLDFESAKTIKPIQKLDLHEDFCGAIEYPLKVTRQLVRLFTWKAKAILRNRTMTHGMAVLVPAA
eukprot:Selendium_serpulae@DN4163_c0_g1_i4.p1